MTTNKRMTTEEVAARFNELAMQEKWFEIQEELFADNVKSIAPQDSSYFKYAEDKSTVREKDKNWVKKVQAVHGLFHTTHPVVSGNHFAVGRHVDLTVEGFGNVRIDQIMLYEVKDGQIVLEQFFY
jgi:hypothetical protein